MCVHVAGKGTCSVNCVTGNRNCVCVTGKKDSFLVTKLAGKKDCFLTGKKETVRTLTVNSCLAVGHVHFAKGYPQKKGVKIPIVVICLKK